MINEYIVMGVKTMITNITTTPTAYCSC